MIGVADCLAFDHTIMLDECIGGSCVIILITWSYSYTYKIIIKVLSYCIDQLKATQSGQNHLKIIIFILSS